MATQWGPGYETRKRSLNLQNPRIASATIVTRAGGQVGTTNTPYEFSCVGRQTTTSKDTLFPLVRRQLKAIRNGDLVVPDHAKRNLERGDTGSNFETVRQEYELQSAWQNHAFKAGLSEYHYNGPWGAVGAGKIFSGSSLFPAVTPPTVDYLFQLGGTAISRCVPTSPAADLATFLGEMREGLPKMVGHNLQQFRKPGKATGGEYLNFEFGIKPLLADLRKLNDAVIKSDVIIQQFLRDSGRLIRRRYSFPVTQTEEVMSRKTGMGLYPNLPSGFYVTPYAADTTGTLTHTRKIVIESWFSGAFTYHVDVDPDVMSRIHRKAQEIRRIYGVELTPEVAWNLSPWSWAADWFANTGSVLSNVSRFSADGLVMRYGYLMYKETIEDTYTHTGVNLRDSPTGPVSQVFRTVYKRRVKAHPFGFGMTDADLSPRQIAILAALGLSRGSAD